MTCCSCCCCSVWCLCTSYEAVFVAARVTGNEHTPLAVVCVRAQECTLVYARFLLFTPLPPLCALKLQNARRINAFLFLSWCDRCSVALSCRCRLPLPKGLDTRDQLLEFHEKHYHAANMALVVLGKENLDHLEGWARECFKEVRSCGTRGRVVCAAAIHLISRLVGHDSVPYFGSVRPFMDRRKGVTSHLEGVSPSFRTHTHMIAHTTLHATHEHVMGPFVRPETATSWRKFAPKQHVFQVRILMLRSGTYALGVSPTQRP